MIQRIQSLFLFLVDIVLIVLLFVPFMTSTMPEGTVVTQYTLLDFPTLIVGQAILCVVAAAALAMFRKRAFQMKLCIAGMILSVIYTGLLAFAPSLMNDAGMSGRNEIGPGTWISLVNFLLFLLAWRFVKKDEELVKSADRIR